ncbi:hypothetical protein E3P98_03521 [Wallemia ichthyophaga]|nr:hypothetical protein E3P98_03521 [Wallemia ichthyophaga]
MLTNALYKTTIIDKSQDSAAWLFTAPINFIFNTLAIDTERGMRPGLYLASTPAEVLPLGCYWNENGEVEYVNNQHEDEESRRRCYERLMLDGKLEQDVLALEDDKTTR